eukprot:6849879-Pyramimonas_sp.AAC.1
MCIAMSSSALHHVACIASLVGFHAGGHSLGIAWTCTVALTRDRRRAYRLVLRDYPGEGPNHMQLWVPQL